MSEPPPSLDVPIAAAVPADDAETIASYKKTFNLTVLTIARGWADHLRARPPKASRAAIGIVVVVALSVTGWLDPATLQSFFSTR